MALPSNRPMDASDQANTDKMASPSNQPALSALAVGTVASLAAAIAPEALVEGPVSRQGKLQKKQRAPKSLEEKKADRRLIIGMIIGGPVGFVVAMIINKKRKHDDEQAAEDDAYRRHIAEAHSTTIPLSNWDALILANTHSDHLL